MVGPAAVAGLIRCSRVACRADSPVVIASLFTVALALPQIVPTESNAVVVRGVGATGRLSLQTMALGDGGMGRERGELVSLGRGRVRTPGGAVVDARTQGVKLTFPNKHALLITPAGRVHLRGGEMTLAHLKGMRLLLADGSAVTVRRAPGGRQPLSSVEVEVGNRTRRIWNQRTRTVNASHVGAFPGPALVAVGDGRVLYSAIPLGPMVVLERVLCPRSLQPSYARVRLVIVADVLAASLQRLPRRAPRKSVQFPQASEAAETLAFLSDRIFPKRTIPRPVTAIGELWFELSGGFRLNVVANDDIVVIGLYGETSETPAVEWTVGGRTELRFVRPFASREGYRGPRYFLRGLDLQDLVKPLLPIQVGGRDVLRARKVIQAIGGRKRRLLPVQRR